jgi:pimeloyl-ACP methyl ester carboxylesterase
LPFATVGGHRLHYEWIGPAPAAAPTLVLLHYGLGCVETWLDFPSRLAEATGYGALVYSRWGYGRSDPVPTAPRQTSFFEDEAWIALPELLALVGVRDALLVGHSDGGTIALLYAATPQPIPVRAVISVAAHVFHDEAAQRSIHTGWEAWTQGALRERLERYHGANTEGMYRSWSDLWMDPRSHSWTMEHRLPAVTCPTLVMQGSEDTFCLPEQVDAIVGGVSGPAEGQVLQGIGHEPHREAPDQTLKAMVDFIARADAGRLRG